MNDGASFEQMMLTLGGNTQSRKTAQFLHYDHDEEKNIHNQKLADDCVTKSFRILIADRNGHVREFLQREFSRAGYLCELAANGQELESKRQDPPHILVLDSDILVIEGWHLFEAWAMNKPRIPVIIHSFLSENYTHPLLASADAVVEKKGNPDSLISAVNDLLARYYPERIFHEASRLGAIQY